MDTDHDRMITSMAKFSYLAVVTERLWVASASSHQLVGGLILTFEKNLYFLTIAKSEITSSWYE